MKIDYLDNHQFRQLIKLSIILGIVMYLTSLFFQFRSLLSISIITTIPIVVTTFLLGAIPGFVIKKYKIAIICGVAYSFSYIIITYTKSVGVNMKLNLCPDILHIIPPILLGLVFGMFASNFNKRVIIMTILGSILGFYIEYVLGGLFKIIEVLIGGGLLNYEINSQVGSYFIVAFFRLNLIFTPLIILYFMLLLFSISIENKTKQFIIDLLSFKGNMSRSDYIKWWFFNLLLQLSIIPLFVNFKQFYISDNYNTSNLVYSTIIYLLISLLFTLILLSLSVKRLKDTGHSWWYIFFGLIPILNIYLLYLLLIKKTVNPNWYDKPKYEVLETYNGISDNNMIKLRDLIKNQKKDIFSKGNNSNIWDLLENMISSKETALLLIDEYHRLFNKDIIEDLKNLTNSYEGIKNNLSTLIKYEVVASEYPHDLLK